MKCEQCRSWKAKILSKNQWLTLDKEYRAYYLCDPLSDEDYKHNRQAGVIE